MLGPLCRTTLDEHSQQQKYKQPCEEINVGHTMFPFPFSYPLLSNIRKTAFASLLHTTLFLLCLVQLYKRAVCTLGSRVRVALHRGEYMYLCYRLYTYTTTMRSASATARTVKITLKMYQLRPFTWLKRNANWWMAVVSRKIVANRLK